MKVLHCSWIPEPKEDFIQPGDFWLWVERSPQDPAAKAVTPGRHPAHLAKAELISLLESPLGLEISPYERRFHFQPQTLLLPSRDGVPLAAPEFDHGSDSGDESAVLAPFAVDAQRLTRPVRQLGEYRFLAFFHAPETRPGSDLLFWHYFSQSLKAVVLKDRYIPRMLHRPTSDCSDFDLYAGWEILSDDYERLIRDAAERMPPICQGGGGRFYEAASLLRHCAEVLVDRIVAKAAPLPRIERKIRGTVVEACRAGSQAGQPWKSGEGLETFGQWLSWRGKLAGRPGEAGVNLVLRLCESETPDGPWHLELRVGPRRDPSRHLSLAEYWDLDLWSRRAFVELQGADFEQGLLLALGQAARIYPALWEGLDQARPTGIELSLEDAFTYLREHAWVLEDAGFSVVVPAWWTPQGRRRAKLRLQASGKAPSGTERWRSIDLDHLVSYRYELALGDEEVSEADWEKLVESKSDLVRFRGRWLALDRAKMREMLEFWRRHRDDQNGMSLVELMRKSAEDAEFFEVEPAEALAEMLGKLHDRSRLQPAEEPPDFGTQLREYQKRGLAWIAFLESLGLNGCLADDMGLGKTVQVLARLAQERSGGDFGSDGPKPTLLVAPTSVIGNWKKEIERFAPNLRAFIHHGTVRQRDSAAFRETCLGHDVVITSYALARKDQKLLSPIRWHRVVLDEAQNIKNPLSAQTRAVLNLNAPHRLALTGTPVENRLLDLWSIFNFLNPGYLGKQSQFRQRYELPVQRDNDPGRAEVLRRLIEPFVLRRVKTDPEIIKDLPEKLENKQFCNLSPEQASLYEAVVRDVEKRLNQAEGIGRQGLILSTLMRLKQICNHPAQFLHDGSAFSAERSPKLERLGDMLGDVVGEGESALVFTQFAEIGARLESFLREGLDCPVYFLHGGVPAARRERMITEFQDAEMGAGVFVLSLKAGGVGITLTKANHVFHFDRWWNPAVEDQATDRAFRIGQSKNVFVHKFITLGTLEERIDRLIDDKKQMASMVVGNDESWLTRLDNETFKDLIALNRVAVLE